MDNPASHLDDITLRILNYSYIYILNFTLIICPIWLSFDWSMGCIDLIQSFDDVRISVMLLFYFTILLTVFYIIFSIQTKLRFGQI